MQEMKPGAALKALLDTSKVGLLATSDTDGQPHTRWVTAAMLPGQDRLLYCVTMAGTNKAKDIGANDRVAWSFQSPRLDTIISVTGRARLLDLPELKAQVLEALGRDLTIFWRIHTGPKNLVVIESTIDDIRLYRPMQSAAHELRLP